MNIVGNLISLREIRLDVVTFARSQTKAMLVENENDIPDVPQPVSLSFCYWSVCYGLGSIFMNWNSLNKMVLWCFHVTVPDPVLLRCYQGSETTTNQKQGGLQSLLASPPLFWCCLLRPLFTACYNLLWAVFLFRFLFFPWWPNTERHVAKAASSLAANGSWPAWFGWCSILHLSSQAYWERKGEELFVFLEEEESGAPACFNMAGILIAEDTCSPPEPRVPSRCLWESQRHLACQGAPDGSPSSPGTGQGCGGQGLLPGLHSLCPGVALSLIGKPLIFRLKEGAVFAHSMPLRLFFSWCYSKFLLGSTKVDVLKIQQEAPFFVIHCHSNFFFFFKYLKNRTSWQLG